MSSLATRLVSWEEFLELPERTQSGGHYELHDGEVVLVAPPEDRHTAVQIKLRKLLRSAESYGFEAAEEFPYRPAANYQYWKADVALVPAEVLKTMARQRGLTWQVYAPPLIVEILSPSNTPNEINRKRVISMSGGTREFWVVDLDSRTVQVTTASSVTTYGRGESIALHAVPGIDVQVDLVFEDLAD